MPTCKNLFKMLKFKVHSQIKGSEMHKKYAVALDVGGTSLKTALISQEGVILRGSFQQTPINSQGSAEEIIKTFVDVLDLVLKKAKGLEVLGIGIGMPGPFDYEQGISLIRGVKKYEAIYGLNVKQEFRKHLNLKKDFPVFFENDAWSFLRGEVWQGAGRDCPRVVGLTLGTGLGSAFMTDGRIITKGPGMRKKDDGGMWQGDEYAWWLGGLPCNGGILEDKISRRGIIAQYPGLDVKEIAESAKRGDKLALEIFERVGAILGKTILPNLLEFKADCLVLGGQISKSFSLFEKPLKKELKSVKVKQAKNIDKAALYGAGKLVFGGRK